MKKRTVYMLVSASAIVAVLLVVGYLMYRRRRNHRHPRPPTPPAPPVTPVATSMQISSNLTGAPENDAYTIILTGPSLGSPTYGTNSVMWSNEAQSDDPVTQSVLTSLAAQPMLISGQSTGSITITFLSVSGATNNAQYQILANLSGVGQNSASVNVPVTWVSS